jgi:hypothetical protein
LKEQKLVLKQFQTNGSFVPRFVCEDSTKEIHSTNIKIKSKSNFAGIGERKRIIVELCSRKYFQYHK